VTLMMRERVVIESILTIGTVTAKPEAIQARWKAPAGRRFGIGVGILSSGAAGSTHGAGPSGRTNAVRPILSGHLRRLLKADLRLSNHPLLSALQAIFRDKSPKTNSMVVDDDNGTSAKS